jgi:hypothetical protein
MSDVYASLMPKLSGLAQGDYLKGLLGFEGFSAFCQPIEVSDQSLKIVFAELCDDDILNPIPIVAGP